MLLTIFPIIVRSGRRPVIFSKFSGIGDIICTFPAALELKKRHPGAIFIYNCYSEFACLPKLAGLTNHVTSFQHIGMVGYWYRFMLGGFYHFASDDDRPDIIPDRGVYQGFGRQFGVALNDEHPRLKSDPTVVSGLKLRLTDEKIDAGPLVVIHPGPSWPIREWPQEYWCALVHELQRRGFKNIIQIGSARDLALGTVGAIDLPGVFSWVDELTLEESVALISVADLFVGIDSGMLHIAAAVMTPAIGLWGPTSSHFRFSSHNARSFVTSNVECQGCHHRVPRLHWMTGCPYDIKCMSKSVWTRRAGMPFKTGTAGEMSLMSG